MNSATKSYRKQILIWLVCALTVFVFVASPGQMPTAPDSEFPVLSGFVQHKGPLFVWQYRLRITIRRRKRTLRRIYHRVAWAMHLMTLVRQGAITMAQIVDGLTRAQIRRHLGALPVLYALLEALHVREIINRHCPTRAEVDHGTVALVLILNRLTTPYPLYQIAEWLSHTILPEQLGIPAAKFNDDRLGRTLDALSQHSRAIWLEVVSQALSRAGVTVKMLFYDLSAFVAHGAYAESQHVDFGFAHNTPMKKRKFKVGLNATADGNIPTEQQLWSGRTTDVATVEGNLKRLRELLEACGKCLQEVLLIGDRATLNSNLALTYDDEKVRYLAGLEARTKAHRALLVAYPDKDFWPLDAARGKAGYWGKPCPVTFNHDGRQVTHQGLIVLSGPMRSAWRKHRAIKLRELRQALQAVRAKIGEPRYRTVPCVQRSANAALKKFSVGKFVRATAYEDASGQVGLRWEIDRQALWAAMRKDGRYLLVTNDPTLSPREMLALYRKKDGVEKDFRIAKSDLKVSPIYLHKDRRIEGMLLIHMLALLAYTILERQAHQHGLQLTTRRIIAQLSDLDIIVSLCWDGSSVYRLVPIDADQAALLEVLAHVLQDLRTTHPFQPQLPSGDVLPLALPPPEAWDRNATSALTG
jgi:transposase